MDRKEYEKEARKTWDEDAEIRKEFLSYEIWLGFCMGRLSKEGKLTEPHDFRCPSVGTERAV